MPSAPPVRWRSGLRPYAGARAPLRGRAVDRSLTVLFVADCMSTVLLRQRGYRECTKNRGAIFSVFIVCRDIVLRRDGIGGYAMLFEMREELEMLYRLWKRVDDYNKEWWIDEKEYEEATSRVFRYYGFE